MRRCDAALWVERNKSGYSGAGAGMATILYVTAAIVLVVIVLRLLGIF